MFEAFPSDWPRGQRASFRQRLHAAGIHLLLSLFIGALAFALVYGVWYPREYWQMAGGRELFFLVVSVDTVLGPLITLVVFNPGKGWGRQKFDFVVIAVLQLSALSYGLWTVSLARPVFMVFTGDRFNLVTSAALDPRELALAERPRYRRLPWTGPEIVGARAPVNQDEKLQMVSDALAGKDVELRPKFYVPYADSRAGILQRALPLTDLVRKNPATGLALLNTKAQELGHPIESLRWLPVVARGDWVVLLDATTGEVLAYLPLNGF